MHEDIEYVLKKYNLSFPKEGISIEKKKRLQEIYPPTLANFIAEYGFVTFHNGLYQLCGPDEFRSILALVFKADPDFNHKECHVVGYSAFGVLQCWSEKLNRFYIELPLSVIYCRALTVENRTVKSTLDNMALGTLIDAEEADFLDVEGEPMYERCVAQYGSLAPGECFGFVSALAFGGAFGLKQSIEHIRKMSALEHFTILAQLEQFYLMKLVPGDVVPFRKVG